MTINGATESFHLHPAIPILVSRRISIFAERPTSASITAHHSYALTQDSSQFRHFSGGRIHETKIIVGSLVFEPAAADKELEDPEVILILT